MDYGFPSGEELLQDIANILNGKILHDEKMLKIFVAYVACHYMHYKGIKSNRKIGDETNYYSIMNELVDVFKERLIRSNAASIDDFLDKNSKDIIELSVIGKIMIVISISMYESEQRLFYIDERVMPGHRYSRQPYAGARDYLSLTRGWYNNLWTKIYEGNIANNLKKLTVISFNYDRSFEHYLFNSIRSMSCEDPASIINKNLLIHHVYGQLGKLMWQNNIEGIGNDYQPIKILNVLNTMDAEEHSNPSLFRDMKSSYEYLNLLLRDNHNPLIDINNICSMVEMIRTYAEASEDIFYSHIKKRLIESERLFFLGFGYHPQNIEWFRKKTLNSNKNIEYAGTTYGKGKVLVREINERLGNLFSKRATLISQQRYYKEQYSEHKIKEYLENVVNIV